MREGQSLNVARRRQGRTCSASLALRTSGTRPGMREHDSSTVRHGGPRMREGQSLNVAQRRQGRSSSGGPSLWRHLRGSEARNAGSPTGSIGGRLAGNVATDSKARSAAVGRSGTIHRQHHCRPGCQHAQQSLGRSGHHPSPASLPAGMSTCSTVPRAERDHPSPASLPAGMSTRSTIPRAERPPSIANIIAGRDGYTLTSPSPTRASGTGARSAATPRRSLVWHGQEPLSRKWQWGSEDGCSHHRLASAS